MRSLGSLPDHLKSPKLLAAFAVGFNVLFSLVPGLVSTRGGWPACVGLAVALQAIVIAARPWREPLAGRSRALG